MFWRMGFAHTSPIENLLDTEDFTLQQLLEEDDIIQECKQLNKKLIDYLANPEQVEALINYVVTEPPEDSEGKVKFIYPYKSSEVLAADLGAVHDCLFANEALLDKLFSFLEREAPLNTLLAGYFGKIVSTLLSRRPDETLKIMESRKIVPQLLRHLGAYSILELLLKLVSEAEEKESDGGAQLEWLYSQDLVGKLIAKLDPSEESDVHANSAVALVGFISQQHQMHWSASLPSAQSRFSTALATTESVSALLERLLRGSPSTLEHGLTVLVELVRHSTSATRGQDTMSAVVVEVLNRMADFVQVLRSPPATPAIINSTGTLDPPLGQNRLKILEVVQALISLKNPEVEAKMIELGVLTTVLDLFFKYEWHNFLHNLVKNLLEIVIMGENKAIKESLFTDGKILTRIIDAHKHNDEALNQPKSCRKGYMGQLRLISNLIQKQATNGEAWMRAYTDGADWVTFCDTYLAQLNDINDGRQLGRSKPNGVEPQSDGEEEDEEDLSIPLGSNFEFRSPDQPDDLFDNDGAGDDFNLDDDGEIGNEMDLDDVELAKLAEGVNALSVDPSGSSPAGSLGGGGQQDTDTQADSPDYNDINFWKPSMNWFE
mmetsp:Transcript_2494/g.3963  ORF Transcript_2494/g.3963 Transcript_2494/m.3963 type:complete len:603 (-) Transcript_2494:38-1846(-)